MQAKALKPWHGSFLRLGWSFVLARLLHLYVHWKELGETVINRNESKMIAQEQRNLQRRSSKRVAKKSVRKSRPVRTH